MPSDPDKPLLQIKIKEEIDRPLGRRAFPRPPEPYSRQDQEKKFGPQFKRLQAVLDRKGGGLELRSDPHALAPERILILEVNGSVSELARAVSRVDGLELLIEEELDRPDLGEAHSLYLLMPEEAALKQILSMWQKWSEGKELPKGFTPWRDVFARLSDVRAWGPRDRVSDQDADAIDELMSDRSEDALLRLELELAPRKTGLAADRSERSLRGAIDQLGGVVVNQARIPEIGYHGLLVDLPGREVRRLLDREGAGLSGHDAVLFVRPQSATSAPAAGDQHEQEIVTQSAPLGKPIAALLDGVPLAAHPALQGRLSVDDLYGLESTDPEHRRHGTAMASLISLGDLGEQGEPLPRRLHVVPVLGGATEAFPNDRLLIDVIWQAVLSMKSGDTPSAEDVLIVNVSLGDVYRPFHGVPSAWARLIDRLAFDHGILFDVLP